MKSQFLLRSQTLFLPQKQVLKPYYPEAMATTTRDLKIHLSKRQRGLRICLCVSSLVILVAAILILIFTIFKPKDPSVFVNPVDLENFQVLSPNSSGAPLNLVITIQNPNYASFKNRNGSGYLKYGDTIIAEIPLESRLFPARSTTNVSTTANIQTEKLLKDPNFMVAVEGGAFNMTSEAKLSGKVRMAKIIRLKAKVYLSCTISLNISAFQTASTCISKLKL
ncbi:uncharacterized protein LOC114169186 [Vigna unguiculata]|uniref:uncharacterized protein LOC114169186 n=1 Tax=Vigna unguiculata TaxID=3917 RepID=UPI001016A342|nr:uncharacterized protein LOC114169186 [Vigna unguiculata]